MTKLKSKFSRREWKDCCGKGCKKCEIARVYIAEYGDRKVSLEKLNADREAVKKDRKRSGKRKGGETRGTKAKKKAKD